MEWEGGLTPCEGPEGLELDLVLRTDFEDPRTEIVVRSVETVLAVHQRQD